MNDEKDFAVVSNVQDVKLTSSFIVGSFILKCTIGVGFLSLPHGYSYCGYVLGLIFFAIFGFATWYCNVSFVECKENLRLTRVSTVGDLGNSGFGIVGKIVCNLMMVVDCFGICISFLMFAIRNLEVITGVKTSFLILITISFLELLSFIRYIKFLGYISVFVNIVTLACVILLLYSVYRVTGTTGEVIAFNWKSFPVMLGTMCFTYNIVSTTLINHNNMEHPSQYKCVYGIVIIILGLFFALFPLFVYLHLGSNTPGLLTDGISEDDYVMKVALISMLLLHVLVILIIWLQPLYLFSDYLFHANRYRRLVINEDLAKIMKEQQELEKEQIEIELKKKADKFQKTTKEECIDTTNYEYDDNMEILNPKLGVVITFTESTTRSSLSVEKRKTRIERWEPNNCYFNDVIGLVTDNYNNTNNNFGGSNSNVRSSLEKVSLFFEQKKNKKKMEEKYDGSVKEEEKNIPAEKQEKEWALYEEEIENDNYNDIIVLKKIKEENSNNNNMKKDNKTVIFNNSSLVEQKEDEKNEQSFFISCFSSFCSYSFSCLNNFKENWKFWILTAFARLVVLVLATIPCWTSLSSSFNLFLSLIGCITGSMTGYLIPILLHLRICWSEISLFRKILDIIIIIIMAPLMIYMTLLTVSEYRNSN